MKVYKMITAVYEDEKFSLTGDGPYVIESEKDHSHEIFKLALEMNGYIRYSDRKPHGTRPIITVQQPYRYKDNRHLYKK